ncbi:MAG: ExeA family protein, partial [Succinivibrio sp.]
AYMYEKFFGLDELPFDGLPDNRFYFVGNCQHEALEILTGNLSRNGAICVLSGPSGSGKTTLVRMLIRSLPKRMRIITIDDPRLDEHMLLATILRASGVLATSYESIAELTLKLRKLLERSSQRGIVTTVICDEAQGLSDEVIEQIRLISNIEGELGKMINFLLVGQEDLIENIQKPMHKMFWGRVKAFASISALKRDEVHSYINFRMQMAGCHDPVFTGRAVNALYKGTHGLPRIINAVADRALCIAFDEQKKHVSGRMIKKAIEVVRHDRSLFVLGLKSFIKECFFTVFAKIPLLLFGVAISASVFYLSYTYLPRVIDSQSVLSLVSKDAVLKDSYEKALNLMMPGRNRKSRELALFDASVKESVFKADSLNTLAALWGYQRKDGSRVTLSDLEKEGLTLRCVQNDYDYVQTVNRPAVLSLRDDNMMPFYAVLYSLDKDTASVIMGNRMWVVKREFLDRVYDGEFTYIGKKFTNDKEIEESVSVEEFNKVLARLKKTHQEIAENSADSKKEMLKAKASILKETENEELVYTIFDNAVNIGVYLEDKK